jgi:hypothetical protein
MLTRMYMRKVNAKWFYTLLAKQSYGPIMNNQIFACKPDWLTFFAQILFGESRCLGIGKFHSETCNDEKPKPRNY